MKADKTQYNYVTGVSRGAIDGLVLASQVLGSERVAVNNMRKILIDAGNITIFSGCLIGNWAAIFYTKSVWKSYFLRVSFRVTITLKR